MVPIVRMARINPLLVCSKISDHFNKDFLIEIRELYPEELQLYNEIKRE